VPATAEAGTVPLHRYYHPSMGAHFYTTNWGELGSGVNGWIHEGTACHVYPNAASGTTPLYRYWNGSVGDHFYTTNWSELGNGRFGWIYEGIQCWVHASAAGAPPSIGAIGGHEVPASAHRPAPPPVFAACAPRLARVGPQGGTAAGDAAVVSTDAGTVQVTVRFGR
jgi:hypothetical protein